MDEQKVTQLVDFYSNMKPAQAANIISKINEELAVQVLTKPHRSRHGTHDDPLSCVLQQLPQHRYPW